MASLSSTNKRSRALRIREIASNFNNEVSRAMIELAEELEAEAASEEAARRDRDDPESSG